MQTVEEIEDVIAGAPGITVAERHGGLVIDIVGTAATVSIAVQGAQVLNWKPQGHEDVLWCSPLSKLGGGKAIRGGVPICWPWFGPHQSDPKKPQHGFARNVAWHLIDVSELDIAAGRFVLTFRLPVHVPERALLQPASAEVLAFIDVGAALGVRIETDNTGDDPLVLTEALHTYFRVGDVSRISIDGVDGCAYRDNADGGRRKVQRGPMMIASETVALFDDADSLGAIDDPVLGRRIRITRDADNRSTVIWNPGVAAVTMADIPAGTSSHFVCVESGNIGAAAVALEPGESHSCGVTYAVEAMA
jgi:glucose-6-phosphate 1-epimerase